MKGHSEIIVNDNTVLLRFTEIQAAATGELFSDFNTFVSSCAF